MIKSLAIFAVALGLAGTASTEAFARKGADNGATHEHKGGRTADGVDHTLLIKDNLLMARRGAGDPAGDDRGGTRSGKGKGGKGRDGADDGANHA